MPETAEIFEAMQSRQLAAFAALGLLTTMVRWNSIPATHLEQAQKIVDQAEAANKVLGGT